MPISVRLDPKTESMVSRLARRRGGTKSEIIREGLKALARAEAGAEARISPYEAIVHLIGCARGGPKDLSERTGEKLRNLLRSRARG